MKINTLLRNIVVACCVLLSSSIWADDITILSVSVKNSTHADMVLMKYEDSGEWKLLGQPYHTICPTNVAPYALGFDEKTARTVGTIGSADIVYHIPCSDGTSDKLIIHASAEAKMIKQFKIFTEVHKKLTNTSGGEEGPAHCSAFVNPQESILDHVVDIEVVPAGKPSKSG